MKKYILLLSLLALLVIIAVYLFVVQNKVVVDAEQTASTTESVEYVTTDFTKYDNIEVVSIERKDYDDRALLHVAYPVTDNALINQSLEAFAEDFIAQYEQVASEQNQAYLDYVSRTGKTTATFGVHYVQHFDVSFANENYVSFTFDRYSSTGGTGQDIVNAKIYDRQTGREILVSELFTSDTYLERLAKLSRTELKTRLKQREKDLEGEAEAIAEYLERGYQMIDEGTKPTKENFNSLVIKDTGELIVYFDKYQVGPGSDGVVQVPVPLAELSDILNEVIVDFFSLEKPEEPVAVTRPPQTNDPDINCSLTQCVALTFDDGPSVYTKDLLQTLAAKNVPATFFVLGRSAKIQSDTVQAISQAGHQLGNHTWDHKDLTNLQAAGIQAQLNQTNSLIKSLTGVPLTTFRPPYGSYNAAVLKAAGVPAILWSVDPRDWEEPAKDVLLDRVRIAQAGDIILLHDIHQPTVAAVPEIIDILLSKDFTLVTVDTLLAAESMTAGAAYRHQ